MDSDDVRKQEWKVYQARLTENPKARVLDCILQGEIHRYHILPQRKVFGAAMQNDGTFLRYIKQVTFN